MFSEIDERKTWLKSIIQSVLGKSPEKIVDQDEFLIYERLADIIFELDSMCEFEKMRTDAEGEEFFKLKIVSSAEGVMENNIRFPKKKIEKAKKLQESIKSKLTKDKKTNIITLLNLLKDELDDE